MYKMKYLIAIFVLLVCHNIVQSKSHCEKLLHKFSTACKLFITHSMENAVPVKMCMQSVEDYYFAKGNYTNLLDATDTSNSNESCKEKYFDHDRLNIVQSLYVYVTGLWDRALCDECFIENSTIYTNLTGEILGQVNNVNQCLEQEKENACLQCNTMYVNLNEQYTENFEKNKHQKICFDIQDAMNRTRFMWSKILHCCERKVQLTAFAVTSSFIACLPVMFYVFMYFYTKRVERNQDTILDNSERGSQNNLPRTNPLIVQAQTNNESMSNPGPTSTREAPETNGFEDIKRIKKNNRKKYINSDSDDEPISTNTSSRISESQNEKTKISKLRELSESNDELIVSTPLPEQHKIKGKRATPKLAKIESDSREPLLMETTSHSQSDDESILAAAPPNLNELESGEENNEKLINI